MKTRGSGSERGCSVMKTRGSGSGRGSSVMKTRGSGSGRGSRERSENYCYNIRKSISRAFI